jgi:hypothetical protein
MFSRCVFVAGDMEDLSMTRLIRREFAVRAPLETTWQHLVQVEQWPSWAKHIKHVELTPKDELTLESEGLFHLANGIKSRFAMTEINPSHNWKWSGPFLWLTVHYDHQFEAVDAQHSKLIWIVDAGGFGASLLGRLFAAIYNKNLDRAIPLLIAEIEGTR